MWMKTSWFCGLQPHSNQDAVNIFKGITDSEEQIFAEPRFYYWDMYCGSVLVIKEEINVVRLSCPRGEFSTDVVMPPLCLGFQRHRMAKASHFSPKSCEHSNVDFKLFRLPFCESQGTAWVDFLLLINQ